MNGQRLAGLLMIIQGVFFTIETAIVHHIGAGVTVMQLGLLRGCGGLLLVMVLARSMVGAVVKTNQLWLQVLRGAAQASFFWILMYAFTRLPFADTGAISYTLIAYIAVFSALILRERITTLRWIASATGMIGALLVTQPAFQAWNIVYVVILLGTSLHGLQFVLMKYLQRPGGDTALTTMFYANVVFVVGNLPVLAPADLPAPEVWPWLLGVLVFGSVGTYLGVVALRYADASALGLFTLLPLVCAVAVGVILFHEIPNVLSWIGIAIILGSCWVAMRPAPAALQEPKPAQ